MLSSGRLTELAWPLSGCQTASGVSDRKRKRLQSWRPADCFTTVERLVESRATSPKSILQSRADLLWCTRSSKTSPDIRIARSAGSHPDRPSSEWGEPAWSFPGHESSSLRPPTTVSSSPANLDASKKPTSSQLAPALHNVCGIGPENSGRDSAVPESTSSRSMQGSSAGGQNARCSSDSPALATPRSTVNEPREETIRRGSSERFIANIQPPESVRSSPSRAYKLIVIQQPSIGSAFEENILSRIGLAPPLIVELHVQEGEGESADLSGELPFLFCQCSLLTEDGHLADMAIARPTPQPPAASISVESSSSRGRKGTGGNRGFSSRGSRATASAEGSSTPGVHTPNPSSTPSGSGSTPRRGPSPLESSSTSAVSQAFETPRLVRMLYGTIVSSPQPFISLEGDIRYYFFFPEISVRAPGKFKLQCHLMRLPFPGVPTGAGGHLATTQTDVFEVVKRREYIAPYITDISRHFARQGVSLLLPPGTSAD